MRARYVMAAGALMLLMAIAAGQARNRPTVDSGNGDTCFNDPSTDKNCNSGTTTDVGKICYCCYDDGCWICGTTPLPGDSCEWDENLRPARGGAGTTDTLTINPGGGKKPKLPPMTTPLQTPQIGPAN